MIEKKKKIGRPPSSTRKGVCLYIENDLQAKLKTTAKKDKTTMSKIVEESLSVYLVDK